MRGRKGVLEELAGGDGGEVFLGVGSVLHKPQWEGSTHRMWTWWEPGFSGAPEMTSTMGNEKMRWQALDDRLEAGVVRVAVGCPCWPERGQLRRNS